MGVVEFLPPIWEIVNSVEEIPLGTLRGITTVYFFLTKDRDILYILFPDLADLDFLLKVRLLGRKVRFLRLNTIRILIITSLLVHRNIVFFGRILLIVRISTILQVDNVESSFDERESIRVNFSRMFITTH